MTTTTVARTIALTIAVALAAIAVNLQADIAPPLFSADTTVAAQWSAGDQGAGAASSSAELPINWQLCPC